MSYQTETNWMDELDSKLRNLEELEAARAKEAWEKHVVSTFSPLFLTPGSHMVEMLPNKILPVSRWFV